MNVLVTGAAGFIGSYVARALIRSGVNVVGIDKFNDYYLRDCKEFNLDLVRVSAGMPAVHEKDLVEKVSGALSNFYPNSGIAKGEFNFYEGDIRDFAFLETVFGNHQIDKVIHLAAMAGVPLSEKKPRLYTEVNIDGTVNLLNLSTQHNVSRFVFGSSSSVYGNREDKKVTEEDDVSKPASVYGATKVSGEVLSHSFYKMFGLPVTIVRIFGPIYGPLQRPYGMFHQRAVNYVFNDKELQIYGKMGLDTAKDSTYIDDEVNGILACLNCDYDFEVFNIGTSNPLPIKTWIDSIEKAFDKKAHYKVVTVDKGDVVSSASIEKAQKMLSYNPSMDMYESVKRQVEIFKLMPKWYQEMEV